MSAADLLVPVPSSVESSGGFLELDATTTLAADPELNNARRWLARTLGAATGWDLFPAAAADPGISLLLDPELDAEAYRLEVGAAVVIHAGGPAGAFYAAQTLLQLMGPAALRQAPVPETGGAWPVPKVSILDHPRFGYRGPCWTWPGTSCPRTTCSGSSR
ncbi:beta-hexosaminidase [Arthrobacter sp. Hiyo8]|nr:beta-hexosaminidase [Arthrobacter sp. Hiyo8]